MHPCMRTPHAPPKPPAHLQRIVLRLCNGLCRGASIVRAQPAGGGGGAVAQVHAHAGQQLRAPVGVTAVGRCEQWWQRWRRSWQTSSCVHCVGVGMCARRTIWPCHGRTAMVPVPWSPSASGCWIAKNAGRPWHSNHSHTSMPSHIVSHAAHCAGSPAGCFRINRTMCHAAHWTRASAARRTPRTNSSLPSPERLGHVVVGTRGQPLHNGLLIVERGEHDDGQLRSKG